MRYRTIFLAAILVACGCNSDSSRKSSQVEPPDESVRTAFLAALGNSAKANEIFLSIAPKVTAISNADEQYRKEVKEMEGDLIALTQSKTNVSEQLAVNVVGALGKHDSSDRYRTKAELKQVIAAAVTSLAKENNATEYSAKKRLGPALKAAWPNLDYRFEPLNYLSPIESAPPVPPTDPEFETLLTNKNFWEDPKYSKISYAEPGDLPDGAIVPLLKLTAIPIPQAVMYDGCTRPMEIVQRYGSRANGAMIAYLTNPASFGVNDMRSPPYSELLHFKDAPAELRKQIIRASLQSGWQSVERYVPGAAEWADALLDEFKDSPYGAPERNPTGRHS